MAANQNAASASRRTFLTLSATASAAIAMRIVTEPMLARAARHQLNHEGVMIDANENPLGPCSAAREAIIAIAPQGGRYCDWLTDDLVKQFAQDEGLKPEYLRLSRIKRASAPHGLRLCLATTQLRHRRSRLRGGNVHCRTRACARR